MYKICNFFQLPRGTPKVPTSHHTNYPDHPNKRAEAVAGQTKVEGKPVAGQTKVERKPVAGQMKVEQKLWLDR